MTARLTAIAEGIALAAFWLALAYYPLVIGG